MKNDRRLDLKTSPHNTQCDITMHYLSINGMNMTDYRSSADCGLWEELGNFRTPFVLGLVSPSGSPVLD